MFVEILAGSVLAGLLVMTVITVVVHSKSRRLPHVVLLAASHMVGYFTLLWLLVRGMLKSREDTLAVLGVILAGALLGILGNYVVVAFHNRETHAGRK